MWSWIGRHYSRARRQEGRAPAPLRETFEAYFRGEARVLGGVPWQASGTPFQLKVLATLSTIPTCETLSYRELAQRSGQPTAVRAVGLAHGANPVAVLVPCRRMI